MATDDGTGGVAGQVPLAGDLTNDLAVPMRQTDFMDGFHDQHLLRFSLSVGIQSVWSRVLG